MPSDAQPPEFSVTTAQLEPTVLVVLGEVDAATAPALERAIVGAVGDVLVDLCETTFMDSSGLHILVRARRRFEGERRMAIACVSGGPVARLFRLAGVAHALNLYPTRETALVGLADTRGDDKARLEGAGRDRREPG